MNLKEKEDFVEGGFFTKVKKISSKIEFVPKAVEIFYCATDSETPFQVRAIAFSALVYFICPIDSIPDPIPFTGFLDDAVIITSIFSVVNHFVTEIHKEKARKWLNQNTSTKM